MLFAFGWRSIFVSAVVIQQAFALQQYRKDELDVTSEADSDIDIDTEQPKDGAVATDPSSKSVKTDIVKNKPLLLSQQDDIFMRYMPKQNAVVCGCGKCGSTSLLEYTYNHVHTKSWDQMYKGKGPPYVQDVFTERWGGMFENEKNYTEQQKIMETAYSFALIRDPKERLVSAWKSKLACANEYGVDQSDRAHYKADANSYRGFVAHIQNLRGGDENVTCMNLEMFAEALLDIKKAGREQYLDRHFLAQDLGCFYRFGPKLWSKVTTISDGAAFRELAENLGTRDTHVPDMHSSTKTTYISKRVSNLLDLVTSNEYKMLKPYLTEASNVKPGASVLAAEPVIIEHNS